MSSYFVRIGERRFQPTVHTSGAPVGEWVGLDTTVVFGRDGQGLTSTNVHGVRGPVGRLEQTLTIRRR